MQKVIGLNDLKKCFKRSENKNKFLTIIFYATNPAQDWDGMKMREKF